MKSVFDAGKFGKAVFVCVTTKMGTRGYKGVALSIEDCARGFWKFNTSSMSKTMQCEKLVANAKSKVMGVWEIDRRSGWNVGVKGAIPNRANEPIYPDRYFCKTKKYLGDMGGAQRIDGPGDPGPMCGRAFLFNF